MEKFAFLAALFLSLSLFPVYATTQDDAFQKNCARLDRTVFARQSIRRLTSVTITTVEFL
jgi:hypothetical protein